MWTRRPLSSPQSSTVILMRFNKLDILRPKCHHFLITQVLHVAFSHSGDHFATCSKDAKVLVWHIAFPDHEVKLKATIDMNKEKVQPPRRSSRHKSVSEEKTSRVVDVVKFSNLRQRKEVRPSCHKCGQWEVESHNRVYPCR